MDAELLSASASDAAARRRLKQLGFADPRHALANLHALTPTPHDAELLAPALPRLLPALSESADPDMALNNLERYAGGVDRAVLFRTLAEHPGAALLLARLGGASQFLSDALRRRPASLAWLLQGTTMRQWLRDELAGALAESLVPFAGREARLNALRRFKYRQLIRIGARDLLGDADLSVTTEELSHLADVCLHTAWALADERLRAQHGAPSTGFAVIGMGKLGGEELNYSSDVDLIFVYGEDGETAGGPGGALEHGEYFARLGRDIVSAIETVTEEGYAFRVDLRLRPEGRSGAVALSLDGYRRYYAERAELWERQALIKARPACGDDAVGRRFGELIRDFVYRPGVDASVVEQIRAMKRQIDAQLRDRGDESNVKLGRGGIREIEFLVQALQLLYGGDDPWLRERTTLKAIFRLLERGYLAPDLGRLLSDAYVHLRTVEHRLQLVHEFQTHSLPADAAELGRLARRLGITVAPRRAAAQFKARHARITAQVHRAFEDFFSPRRTAGRAADAPMPRLPGLVSLRATGFADPERARNTLRLLLEGRPLVPYPAMMRSALARLFPLLMNALWRSPDPDEALRQFERFVSASGPRTGYLALLAEQEDVLLNFVRLCARGDLLADMLVSQPELLRSLSEPQALAARKREVHFRAALAPALAPAITLAERRDRLRRIKQAEELGVVWRYLLSVTSLPQYSAEMTALAEATLAAGWTLAMELAAEKSAPPDSPAVIIGVGKLGGRELTTGSDLDLFVVYGDETDRAHEFYTSAVEHLAALLGDITAAGVAFPIDLRIRPGSKGSGFASSLPALQRYYREYGDLWERQTLTRARLVLGDPALGRRVRRALDRVVYGAALPRREVKEIADVRQRMELELGKETPGRFHVKYGRGGVVDVEFLTQTLQLLHGAAHPTVRRQNTSRALVALARAGVLGTTDATELREHYGALRTFSLALRLFGARPSDTLDIAGPMPARVARALDYPDREALLADYRRRTAAVRGIYERVIQ
jgi:glutamate-ammonia-ligase adenylyltransferase